ncbi:hypothetical protein [Paradevosia shaoguanensis]|jgi:hypothetical protein|uniref:DUF732 domain-containing protein n=1 Tax=Paradevosia shaoguanensis TaxID=1335043 RepID=A0AA41UAX5_9HYPH|nr:hypothetical protein [Paradevosia shaoguanensis]KFL26923.1 hypothetical protein JP74_10915 [Devosia sp. 17-2-E-8]MBI4046842.1 hypothetical protein [Devosia nanyangense]QMV02599.1 hypothetical protein GHV40_14415 [Devosia sp. D6-9]CDP50371.1 hypothetical protein [Devosia sp. DBB001]MCF1742039.1 hypothetical protein [Paradevosia shaoguanensis]
MNIKVLATTVAFASTLLVPGFALAQEEHMIGGKAVAADQVAEVQAKCDELRKATPMANAAPAADASTLWTADGKVDLTKLTVAFCDEGKFAAPAQ